MAKDRILDGSSRGSERQAGSLGCYQKGAKDHDDAPLAGLLDRSHRETAHELAGHDDAENNYRQGDQGAGRHDLAPWQFVAA